MRKRNGEQMENKANSRNKRSPQSPSRLPRLFMMPTNTKTNLPIRLEPAAGCQEAETWRPQGICGRENYAAVVNAVVVRPFGGLGACCCGARVTAWWAAKCEVPFEEVVVEGCGGVIRARAAGEFGSFAN